MRRILACLLVLSMMLAFSACQNTKPAGTPDEPSVPAEPVEPVQPDEPAQPDTPEQPSEPDAPETPEEPSACCLPLSYQTNRYYGMFDEGMKSYVDYPRIRVDGGDWPRWPMRSTVSARSSTTRPWIWRKISMNCRWATRSIPGRSPRPYARG